MAINGNKSQEVKLKMEECIDTMLYVCGYLPGVSQEKSSILTPVPVLVHHGDSWKDVCGGGCGFAMAISGSGKLMTLGSTDEEGQSYLTAGKHGEIPEPFPLPDEACSVKAAAGWSHCASVTETGEVYTWGWKECVPSMKFLNNSTASGSVRTDTAGTLNALLVEQVSPRAQGSLSQAGEEILKKRKASVAREDSETSSPGDDFFTHSPSLVAPGPGVKVTSVAAGGRHTLALSDMGQVWGWGYGGEGQLGLGSRIKMVSSPHLIPCIDACASGKDRSLMVHQGSMKSSAQASKLPGSYVKEIACGGRHSAVVTGKHSMPCYLALMKLFKLLHKSPGIIGHSNTGALLTFGWGLYGQCGQGNTNDVLRPACVPSLLGYEVEKIAAGLWHTVCITADGGVYAFGGNQFGQLGTGADQAQTRPRKLDASSLESKHAKIVSCGARHSVILTDDQVYSWGWNKYGQLGLGDSIDRNIPSQVSTEGYVPKNVACGWWHTLLLADAPH
ncbi:ultraviolet-B receptor UVR8-like isoform X2 [Euphorbia lathyris]|uniref:ultraviolet-B receptor UVR8-like isoform X2 n=1 Tax=Euphorbia lathyris TaxID=212925 RepID=UPI0033141C0A